MTISELQAILSDKAKKLSIAELKQVIYELKQDSFAGKNKIEEEYDNWGCERDEFLLNAGFYNGEQNAFQIALDLLEHLEEAQPNRTVKYSVGDTVWYLWSWGVGATIEECNRKYVVEDKVMRVYKGKNKTMYYLKNRSSGFDESRLFPSREAAEARLKEL